MKRLARSWKKILGWSLFAMLFLIALYWLLLNLVIWRPNSYVHGQLTSDTEEAFEKRSLIAIYKTNSIAEKNRIGVERMRLKESWKYVFYSPEYYSERFSVNPSSAPEHTKYIIADDDTVVKSGISSFEKLPRELKVYISGNESNPIIYYLDQKFQENIDNIPSVPFFEKIDSGPLLHDD